jgi:transposase InsO family protein
MIYDIGKILSPKLVIVAINMAIATRKTDNLIHHSDQGIQYTCKEYIKILKNNGIRISMSAKSNPYDNAFAE